MFPTTPILDSFNTGASQNLTARAGWGATAMSVGTSFATDGTPTLASVAALGGNFWNTGSDRCECYVRITADAGSTFDLCTRIQNTGSGTTTYYSASLSGVNTLNIRKSVAGTFTDLTSTITPGLTKPFGLGVRVINDTIMLLFNANGSTDWVQLQSANDSAITGNGFMGGMATFNNASISIDYFGAGVPTEPTLYGNGGSGNLLMGA